MGAPRVLIVGAGGSLGRLLVAELLERPDVELVAAGRDRGKLTAALGAIIAAANRRPALVELDLGDRDAVRQALGGVRAAVCAAGPYQELPQTLLQACLDLGVPYIDLAGERAWIDSVRRLFPRPSAPAVCAGWSTAPALSGALSRFAAAGLTRVDSLFIHVAPGRRAPRGAATLAGLLRDLGRPFNVRYGGSWRQVRGWSEPRSCVFPEPVGRRVGHLVDAPDHGLFPELFGAKAVELRVGTGLWALDAAASALSLVPVDWSFCAPLLRGAASLLGASAADAGGVLVEVRGRAEREVVRRVGIVAPSRGARVALLPALVQLERLVSSVPVAGGLVPWHSWIDWRSLDGYCRRLGFTLSAREEPV
ncbi:MAG: saccharopine dehydrogenase NADP-binding domain-containing protein [Elusimicrobia bacterium]|nr:saccharopine dehydrogenase NADP-binding domain-containing protein [Elusimicrobiota bacterium]